MDRLAQFQAFVQTVDRGSQTAAARDLGLTPAMVGRHLRALEDRLGARLLNRTTTTQSLTEAGTAFYAEATAALDQVAAAEAAVLARQAAPHGLLRLSAPVVFGTRYLASWLAEFTGRHPTLRVDLSLNDRVVDLVDEGFDAALRIGQPRDSSLIARRLSTCRVLLCAAPSYLAAAGAPATPEDLRHHECLIYAYAASATTWRLVGLDGRRVAVEVAGRFIANHGEALHRAALAGAGIACQPAFICASALRDGRLVPVLPEWRLDDLLVQIVYPSARHLAPKVRALADFLRTRLAGTPPWERP